MIYEPLPLPYIHHPEFDDPKAVEEIISYQFDETRDSKILNDIKYKIVASAGVLTAEAELALFKKLNLLKKINYESPKAKFKQQIQELRSLIVFYNIRLICKMFVYKFKQSDLYLEDYLADGTLSLYKAVDKFDISTGNKFSTYACVCLLRSLQKPVNRYTTSAESCSVPDKSADLINQMVEDEFTSTSIKKLLKSRILTPREIEIIRLRYGFHNGKRYEESHTLLNIADKYGLSKERVRQILDKALDKSRYFLKEHGYDLDST